VPGAHSRFLPRTDFPRLIEALCDGGYHCVGPQVRDGAIVYDDLTSADRLPHGRHDRQQPGEYRLVENDTPRCFAWANGPQALKPYLFAAREPMWRAERDENGVLAFTEILPEVQPLAVLGVRACDLAALKLQDAHFMKGAHADPYYSARREGLFLVAVNCSHPAETCFCASTGDGPEATDGYDLVLSELDDGFLISSRSTAGQTLLDQLPTVDASTTQIATARAETQEATESQTRSLPGSDLQTTLFARLNHPRWQEIGERCLSCANCTSVCPTCFCFSNEDQAALTGESAAHHRQWDSCFTMGHSYIHGMVVRPDATARYKQWMTHKLGGWHAQYGRSGCVGCGRCITWCPVGIDLTDEAAAICATDTHEGNTDAD